MSTYTVLTPLRLDGRLYQPGEVVEIADAAEAARLVDDGVVEPGGDTAAPAPAPSGEESHARLLGLVSAAAALDPAAKDSWTRDGRPTIAALEAACAGVTDVSAAERDRVWELTAVCLTAEIARSGARSEAKQD